jgi:hypothetical protein
MNSKRAAVAVGWAGILSLFSTSSKADRLSDPNFDLEAFHRHARAGTFRYKIVRVPECVKGKGIQGEFVMTTPEQSDFPLSVTTVVGPSGAKSFVTSTLPTSPSVLSDVASTFNEEAREMAKKIIADCKVPEA